ncbi:permease [Puteibacter caeruleilacunae]|nr:permease [Puteibacter caeruleilacunae]
MNIGLWITTGILLLLSLFKSKTKTMQALQKALKKFTNILPLFLLVMAGFAVLITFVSPDFIKQNIGADSGLRGMWVSLGIGSISVLPGFAAFPLCGALKDVGIPYYILGAFSLSLMNVGVVTFPLEKKFLGLSVALIRNLLSLVVCVIAVILIKIVFGE